MKLFSVLLFIFISFIASAKASEISNSVISLHSTAGQDLLKNNLSQKYRTLCHYFVTQKEPYYCSIASMVMILNALEHDKKFSDYHFPITVTQENFFTPKVKQILNPKVVAIRGTTLDRSIKALNTYPVKIQVVRANEISLNELRRLIQREFHLRQHYIIANYLRSAMNQRGGGHFSPIASYDQKTDRVLIMDVQRNSYPPVWVRLKDFWLAMRTINNDSQYRGLILVSNI